MRYALIANEQVILVVEQDGLPAIEGVWVASPDNVGPGHTYIDSTFAAPAIVATPVIRHITLLALNLRLTRAERNAIRAAEQTDSDVSDIMYLMRQARYIDLDNQTTIASLNALEAAGLLDTGRAAEIISDEVLDIERSPA